MRMNSLRKGERAKFSVEYKGMIISCLLEMDSFFCPTLTLSCIGTDDSTIRPNGMMVKAFDETKTSACGEIDPKVLIGPCEFDIPFIVDHILVVFNLLQGCPKIHTAGATPSSLHQKVKFISDNNLITRWPKKTSIYLPL